ncbi:MAG: hypothetical protein LLG37_06520 [Spirochaetia bacterium]|nr:hypothetical protein [Spirochaetia bacterium]
MNKILFFIIFLTFSIHTNCFSSRDSIAGDLIKQGGKSAVSAVEKGIFTPKQEGDKNAVISKARAANAYAQALLKNSHSVIERYRSSRNG